MDKLLGLTLDNDDNKKEIVAWTSTDRKGNLTSWFHWSSYSTNSPPHSQTLTRQNHS